MKQNTHDDCFRLRRRPQTRECIMLWLDEFGLQDADDEAVACLVKRLDTLDAPFDHDPERIEAFIGDLIEWVSATVDGQGQKVLLQASAMLSEAFVEAGVIEKPRCVARKASQETDDAEPAVGTQDGTNAEANFRPIRRDLFFTSEIEIELVDGSRGSVLHPPFDGKVKMRPARGRSRIVPLDDLTDGSLRALREVGVRRRVEIHSRCSFAPCSQAIRLWLTEDLRVEDIDGETECRVQDLFWARCPKHPRKK